MLRLPPKVPPHGTSPAPRAIHVTNGTLVISFARAYSSGIATVIVPELMRPAIILPHAYLARNNPDFIHVPQPLTALEIDYLTVVAHGTPVRPSR